MATWTIDSVHSDVKFKVKHLVVSTVTGHFTKFEGTIVGEKDDFTDAKITFSADANSIDTRNEQRDGHLKSPDFFDVATYPKIEFVSTSFSKKSDGNYELVGNLSLHGVTKEQKLNVEYNGTSKGMDGSTVAGFEVTGKITRSDYGLKWNAALETGGVALSDEIKLEAGIELKKA